MIPKGNPHNSAARLGRYLFKTEPGERAYILEVRGFGIHEMTGASRVMTPDEIVAALKTIEVIAAGTKAEQPFLHGQVRIAKDERLADGQWIETVDRMEARIGLKGQPRVIGFHENELTGERHVHIAWSRIDAEKMKAINLHQPTKKMMQVARELEREFGLRELRSERERGEPRAPGRNELEEARRLDVDERAVRREIRQLFDHADSGHAFKAALNAREMELTNGSPRDCFVVIDREGGHHALNKKLLDIPAKDIRARLADLDRRQLENADIVSKRVKEQRQAERAMEQANSPAPATGSYSRDEETIRREVSMLEAADRAAPELARRMEAVQPEPQHRRQHAAQAEARARHEAAQEAARVARAAQLAARPLRQFAAKADSIGRAGAPIARGAERVLGGIVDGLTDVVANAGRYGAQEREAKDMSETKTPRQIAEEQQGRNPMTHAEPDVENKIRYHPAPDNVALQELRRQIEYARRQREEAERSPERERGRER